MIFYIVAGILAIITAVIFYCLELRGGKLKIIRILVIIATLGLSVMPAFSMAGLKIATISVIIYIVTFFASVFAIFEIFNR